MQKFILICAALLALMTTTASAQSQRFFTRDAKVQFFSDAAVEDIHAVNKSGTAVLDIATGKMEWKVLIKNFLFEKALMQEHFNENYMESTQYPNATFKGQITNMSDVNFGKDGSYVVKVSGQLTIHGVTRDVNVTGKITVAGGNISIHSELVVKCSDYNIRIEAQKVSNIANEIKITVDATLAPMK